MTRLELLRHDEYWKVIVDVAFYNRKRTLFWKRKLRREIIKTKNELVQLLEEDNPLKKTCTEDVKKYYSKL